jgi:hypothetical protein
LQGKQKGRKPSKIPRENPFPKCHFGAHKAKARHTKDQGKTGKIEEEMGGAKINPARGAQEPNKMGNEAQSSSSPERAESSTPMGKAKSA